MAKNYVQDGEHLDILAGATITSGQGYIVGNIFGVALTSAVSGEWYRLGTKGVWELAKLSTDVVTVGARLYWDDANKRLTLSATGTKLVGVATEAAGNGVTLARVRLDAISFA